MDADGDRLLAIGAALEYRDAGTPPVVSGRDVMLYASIVILAFTVVLGVVGLALLLWAARTGQLRRINDQAWLALDERDRRLERPWESKQAKAERARTHGSLVAPRAGEWGGH